MVLSTDHLVFRLLKKELHQNLNVQNFSKQCFYRTPLGDSCKIIRLFSTTKAGFIFIRNASIKVSVLPYLFCSVTTNEKTAIYKTRNTETGNRMQGMKEKRRMFARIPGSLLEDSRECYHFNTPENV